MLYKLYKGNSPYVIILIIITGIVLWIPGLIKPGVPVFPFEYLQMPFYAFIVQLAGSSVFSKLAALGLLLLTGFYLNRLSSEYGFLKERTQIPALFFILINSAFYPLLRLTPAILTGVLFLFAVEKIFLTYRKDTLNYNFFEASIILSFASMFYMPIIVLWPVIFAGLIILRPVIWREWALSFMGLTLPFFFLFSIQFIRLGEIGSTFIMLIDQFSIANLSPPINLVNKIFFVWLLLMVLLGSMMMIRSLGSRKIFSRKVFLFMFWIFVFSILSWLLIKNAQIEIILFSSIPISYLISEYFLSLRSGRWREILFTLFVLSGAVSVYSVFFQN